MGKASTPAWRQRRSHCCDRARADSPGGGHLEPYFALSEANSPVCEAVIAFIAKNAATAR